MAVMMPWLGAAVLGLLILATGITLWLAGRRRTTSALPVAFPERLRELPRFRQLARTSLRLLVLRTCCLLLAGVGVALLAARLIDPVPSATTRANRDVVLCLDVSGSMTAVDRAIVDNYLELADRLAGERIGLVLFDSTAVTVFPLTDDPDWIREQLLATRAELSEEQPVGTNMAPGSSLIGDGLVSCVQRFDEEDRHRSRTIVLATDNELAGEPLFTLAQATDRAVERQVMIYGISPTGPTADFTEFRRQARRTHGEVLTLGDGKIDMGPIQDAILAQEQVAGAAQGHQNLRDLTWPGALLGLVGIAGAVATDLVRRRR